MKLDEPLSALEVLVIDCQTTGASPRHGQILELGWARATGTLGADFGVNASVVALPEGKKVSRRVRELTGITSADLETAVSEAAIWQKILSDAPEDQPTVIHFARFERAFLKDLFERYGGAERFPFQIVCTHEIARRLLPNLPRRSLKALAGYFGWDAGALKRSASHVEATVHIWRRLLVELDASLEISTWSALEAWLEAPPPKRTRRVYPMPRAKRLALPDEPGVYRFLRENGDILYVGKATSLKARVNSYFTKQKGQPERTLELLSQVKDVEVTVTATPLQAALLETDEIKRLLPPYNVALVEGGRQVCFASPDLLALSNQPDDMHRLGPFPARAPLHRLALLIKAIGGEALDELSHGVLFGPWAVAAIEASVLEEGLERIRSASGGHRFGLFALGRRLWRVESEEDVSEAPPSEEVDEPVWDADRVEEALLWVLVTSSHLIRRARWLTHLAQSEVTFTDGQYPRQTLWVDEGQIGRAWSEPRSFRARQVGFDIAAYDRLRVLTSEMRRIVTNGGDVSIRFSGGRMLKETALRRVLEGI